MPLLLMMLQPAAPRFIWYTYETQGTPSGRRLPGPLPHICSTANALMLTSIFSSAFHPIPPLPLHTQGVLWTLDMYLASDCPDYRFTYECEAPTAAALIQAAAGAPIRRKRLAQVWQPPM